MDRRSKHSNREDRFRTEAERLNNKRIDRLKIQQNTERSPIESTFVIQQESVCRLDKGDKQIPSE